MKTNFFGKNFVPLETNFVPVESGNCYPVETIFFYSVVVSCKWKPLLKQVETSSLLWMTFYKWPLLISKYRKQYQFCRHLKITFKQLFVLQFSDVTQLSLYLPQKCKVNLSPFNLLSLRLGGVETLKYHCVCRPPFEKV